MRRLLALLLLASLCVLAACGGGEEEPAPARTASPAPPAASAPKADETVAFRLREENRSGSSGTARLRGGERGFAVALALKRAKGAGPAHIHNVTCAEYRALKDFNEQLATVEVGLGDLVDGRSRTQVERPLSQYRNARFSINVHSNEGGFPVVACGNIPAG